MKGRRDPVGGWAPDFVLPDASGTPVRFFGRAGGRPTVLLLARGDGAALNDAIAALPGGATDLAVWVITTAKPEDNAPLAARLDGVPVLSDSEGAVCDLLGVGDAPTALLLDPSLRVRATAPASDGLPDAIETWLSGLAAGTEHEVREQAPVLMIPEVLSETECAELIERWESDHAETGIETSRDGARTHALVATAKRRQDHIVQEPARLQGLTQRIGRVLMPAIRRAFAYRATRFEGFKICCYDAEARGFFAPHRDNLSPATAHRRFALSLNLNDDYEGGHLRFPEYGSALYRPGTGGAIVFSGSLLHEALPVTAGRRFVLLSFLFGEGSGRIAPS